MQYFVIIFNQSFKCGQDEAIIYALKAKQLRTAVKQSGNAGLVCKEVATDYFQFWNEYGHRWQELNLSENTKLYIFKDIIRDFSKSKK